ncbi:hypothetical protein H6F46_08610 [Limnothrix sp. FACHB-1083]|nr:hypothetical protein [Limnothrix sp. FACHB-1083]
MTDLAAATRGDRGIEWSLSPSPSIITGLRSCPSLSPTFVAIGIRETTMLDRLR